MHYEVVCQICLILTDTYCKMMGAVFGPKDLRKGYEKITEDAIKDLSPDTKDSVIKVFESWDDINSREKLNSPIWIPVNSPNLYLQHSHPNL